MELNPVSHFGDRELHFAFNMPTFGRRAVTDEDIGNALFEHHQTDLYLEELSRAFVCLGDSKAVAFRDCYLALQEGNFLESTIFKRFEQTVKFLSTDELLARLQVTRPTELSALYTFVRLLLLLLFSSVLLLLL